MRPIILLTLFAATLRFLSAQGSELKSIDEVIQGIDSLLEQIDQTNEESSIIPSVNEPSVKDGLGRSFRVEDELLPEPLRGKPSQDNSPKPVETSLKSSATAQIPPSQTPLNYTNMSLEELLKEVDMLNAPDFKSLLNLESSTPIDSLPRIPQATTAENSSDILAPSTEFSTTEPTSPVVTNLPPQATQQTDNVVAEDYVVLGESIDLELKEKIREAIMSTRLASGGSGNPFVTRSVHKATSYCNRVLGRLNAPFLKRYRRDILLSLINMHDKNQAWVDSAKTYERFLEEFSSDDDYPFEQHEDAPGIPGLHAKVGNASELISGFKRGAPTIPETHIRLGKIYREIGATRMALNKFYDAINATLTLPYNDAFTKAEMRKGRDFESRKDEEANQAMFEIAETFLQSEDYDNAIKFYDRLNRLEQLDDSDRSIVLYKKASAHFRRASHNLSMQEKSSRSSGGTQQNSLSFEQTPRADFARVKEILRGYGTLFPASSYIPETHYLLALAYEHLSQDEESIAELLNLLREAEFNPDAYIAEESLKPERDRDIYKVDQMKKVWAFWKKKTGNYLANKYYEDGKYFNAYRIYSALRPVDVSPFWQVPLLYQIALCEEKLGNFVQATETYLSIEDYVESAKEAREDLANSKYLNFVFGMAKWRRDQLEDTREIRQAVNRFGIYSSPARSAEL
jgi:hypothetical protein